VYVEKFLKDFEVFQIST